MDKIDALEERVIQLENFRTGAMVIMLLLILGYFLLAFAVLH